MKQIYLENTAKGFPADDNLLKTIEEQREALRQVCISLFGLTETVILSGLELTTAGRGAEIVTTLSSGYVWLLGEVLAVDEQIWNFEARPEHIWLGKAGEEITATYENGEELPTYRDNRGYAVYRENIGIAVGTLRNYEQARRVGSSQNICQDLTTIAEATLQGIQSGQWLYLWDGKPRRVSLEQLARVLSTQGRPQNRVANILELNSQTIVVQGSFVKETAVVYLNGQALFQELGDFVTIDDSTIRILSNEINDMKFTDKVVVSAIYKR